VNARRKTQIKEVSKSVASSPISNKDTLKNQKISQVPQTNIVKPTINFSINSSLMRQSVSKEQP
tara:strand:+ start:247 stop:438 length:192 start_codon:yes stop_codon:yes gene_type:complete